MPELSVLVPTHARPEKLGACVGALLHQDFAASRYEILIGIDGPARGEFEAIEARFERAGVRGGAGSGGRNGGGRPACRVFELPRGGPAATRNALLSRARGEITLLLNDDVVPDRGALGAHVAAQRELLEAGRTAMVLGASPWRVPEDDRLFDRLIRETSMVFFYDQMVGPRASDRGHDWGFRHAWTLNLSVPTAALREVGGFDASLPGACYEDLECAWRVARRFGAPVLYRPEAVVTHDHVYEPLDYLGREVRLGHDAWLLARSSPACALEVFRRDVGSEEEVAACAEQIERERGRARELARSFMELASMPARAVREQGAVAGIYQHHLALKRWLWRVGLVAAARGEAARGEVLSGLDVGEMLGVASMAGAGGGGQGAARIAIGA